MIACIIANMDKCYQHHIDDVAKSLTAKKCDIIQHRYTNLHIEGVPSVGFDFAVVMGGDGTIIRAAHIMRSQQKPIIGINFGKLGYLAQFDISSFHDFLDDLLSIVKDPQTNDMSHRAMLDVQGIRPQCSVGYADLRIFEKLAVNDLVLDIGPPFRAASYEIWINGDKLQTITGDGVIIATPTGSTAYTLATGGPIVQPELSGFSITPKNVHKLSIRPIVIRDDQEIVIKIPQSEGIWAIIDGQFTWQLHDKFYDAGQNKIEIVISRYPKELCLVNRPGITYWHSVREKLSWGK